MGRSVRLPYSMPKPNFVKKPMAKLLDEPLSKLPNIKSREDKRASKHRRSFFEEQMGFDDPEDSSLLDDAVNPEYSGDKDE